MTHLSDSIVCPHCGDRYRLESKTNKAGDRVRRGVCPLSASGSTPWATEWEMVSRAEVSPAAAARPDDEGA